MIGQTISHYRILEKLGEGGMGVVYRAEDTKLKRTVALKFLPYELTQDETAKQRFIQEAQSASALQHVNICTIHDIDETNDGSLFIVMDCYEGETLKKIIDRGALQIDQALHIAGQIADGLSTAHRHGIIHRDIKPANIIVTTEGVVKIVDFGLAKLAGTAKVTKEGVVSGTVGYMSPEQVQGGEIDYRTDIWSFGVVFYEMLAGHPPFRSEFDQAIMYCIVNEQATPISLIRSDVPGRFLELIDRCLEKNPAARTQSMEEVVGSLAGRVGEGTKRSGALRRMYGARRIALALPGAVLMVVLGWYVIGHLIGSPPTKPTLAIMRFRDDTGDSLVTGWSVKIQWFLSSQFTGAQGIEVTYYDYLNDVVRGAFGQGQSLDDSRLSALLSNSVDYLLTGSIFRQAQTIGIRATLVETKKGNQLQSFVIDVADKDQLGPVLSDLSQQVLAYMYTQILQSGDKDLAIWKQRSPKNWQAVQKFSTANELIMKGQNALPVLEKAVELDSTFLSPRIWMMPGLIVQGKKHEAEQHYTFLQQMKPSANSFESAMIDWVGAFLTDDYAQQARHLRLALMSSKNNRILLDNLAYAESRLGNYRDAVEALRPCIESNWSYAPVYRTAGECLLKLGEAEIAKELLTEALSHEWVDVRVYPMLAAIYTKQGESSQARHFENLALERYREYNRPYGLAYERIASYLADLGAFDAANLTIQKALDEDKKVASYHGQFAEILLKKGKLDEAQLESATALNLDSSYSRGYYLLGQILDKKGDQTGTITNCIKYLSFDSTSYEAESARTTLRSLQR